MTCWGTGTPLREFLHVDDLGEACVFALEHWQPGPGEQQFLNVGTGLDLTIRELAEAVAAATGFQGEILWDNSKPDGTPKKQLDVSRLAELGWRARIPLAGGLGRTVALCRRVLSQRPKSLVLLERNEFALYAIHQELHGKAWAEGIELVPVLADVADQPRMEMLLRCHGITVLLHAAAYKHVPLVEANVCAGLANNIFGTRSALDAAMVCGLKRFTLISTDKAVRPTNVMGASKRVCELLVQDAAARVAEQGRGAICSMVRFGNVLGSSGSVVPLFREQIASGGPVTVTHPEITRYFMTIPEAAQLVLQASGMAKGGEVFVLDMGEPVRLVDLARQMVELSSCTVRDSQNPDGDIAITFTGLRPGEKLYEELLLSDTDQPTGHPLIRQAREARLGSSDLSELLAQLKQTLEVWDTLHAKDILQKVVLEYQVSAEARSSDQNKLKMAINRPSKSTSSLPE